MLKACAICGKIHDRKIQCRSKIKYIKNTELDKFRSTQAWKDKREDIKKRDEYMCQACFHNLKGSKTNKKLIVKFISSVFVNSGENEESPETTIRR